MDEIKLRLRIPSHCGALWSSIRWLSLGLLCGIYLLNGWTYVVIPTILFAFFNKEYSKTTARRFSQCRREYVDKACPTSGMQKSRNKKQLLYDFERNLKRISTASASVAVADGRARAPSVSAPPHALPPPRITAATHHGRHLRHRLQHQTRGPADHRRRLAPLASAAC